MPELPPNMRPDAFAGVAQDYARYRLPYPRVLLDEVMAQANLPAEPRLLDLACGPGRTALPIADRFAEVWAVDQEPDMVEAERREASALPTRARSMSSQIRKETSEPPASSTF